MSEIIFNKFMFSFCLIVGVILCVVFLMRIIWFLKCYFGLRMFFFSGVMLYFNFKGYVFLIVRLDFFSGREDILGWEMMVLILDWVNFLEGE